MVTHSELQAVDVDDPALVASIIDEIPVLAVAATQAHGRTTIRGAAELRNKESDRIDAMVTNLRALGARVEAFDDGLAIEGPTPLTGAAVSSFGDHRIAMAMAVAGLIADGRTEIDDASVVDISYPRFFLDLRALAR
jgi:3-phosphoshikimate 1-carboxyvinyltransferase